MAYTINNSAVILFKNDTDKEDKVVYINNGHPETFGIKLLNILESNRGNRKAIGSMAVGTYFRFINNFGYDTLKNQQTFMTLSQFSYCQQNIKYYYVVSIDFSTGEISDINIIDMCGYYTEYYLFNRCKIEFLFNELMNSKGFNEIMDDICDKADPVDLDNLAKNIEKDNKTQVKQKQQSVVVKRGKAVTSVSKPKK